ncbi:fucolectin-5-like, partial [Argopecten irradians]|uniref:fucolectin-5-like n=1 Tax=Argopecten irradians TaxID=31199 RepID=UPI00370F8B5B
NVALRRSAIQSSEQDVNKWPARNAIDGCINQDINSGCCSVTKAGRYKQAWWRVDLGVFWTIDYITIYYRSGSGHRFGGYSLYTTNYTAIPPQGIPCYEDNSSLPSDLNLNPTHVCPSVARYVTVYNKRETPPTRVWYDNYAVLELCEVQVFGCPIGTYGSVNCNNNCSASCFGGNCNAVSGHCFYCSPGKYGDLCQQNCAPNCNMSCEKDSGDCIGCIDGKTGDLCSNDCQANCVSCSQSSATDCFECINGKHGGSCQLDCSKQL